MNRRPSPLLAQAGRGRTASAVRVRAAGLKMRQWDSAGLWPADQPVFFLTFVLALFFAGFAAGTVVIALRIDLA